MPVSAVVEDCSVFVAEGVEEGAGSAGSRGEMEWLFVGFRAGREDIGDMVELRVQRERVFHDALICKCDGIAFLRLC